MGKIAKFLGSALLGGTLLFNSLGNAQINPLNKTVRYINPMMKYIDSTQVGIPGRPVYFKNNQTGEVDTLITNSQGYVNVVTDVDEIDENEVLSNKYNVQIYGDANRVNFKTNIEDLTIKMYDMLGREVKTIQGNSWNLENNHGTRVSAGTYPFMIYDKDKIVSKGLLINDGRNIAHRITNLEKGNKAKQSSLEKITTGRYTLEFVDENNEFYRIVDDVDDVNNFKDEYETVPKSEFQTPDLQGEPFLDYFKRVMGTGVNTTTGDTISVNWLKQDTNPQKVFYNRAEAPSQLYINVLENLLNKIKDSTQINYKGYNIPRQNLVEEDTVENSEGSINFGYSNNFSWTDFPVRRLPLPGMPLGVPYRSTVFINNTFTDEQLIERAMTKELLMQALVAEVGENFPTEREIYPRRIRALMLSRVLSDYFNLSRIRH